MTKLFKLDGEEYREYTTEEYAQAEKDAADYQAEQERLAAIEAKKLAALEKLTALGLDEDDLKALGLG